MSCALSWCDPCRLFINCRLLPSSMFHSARDLHMQDWHDVPVGSLVLVAMQHCVLHPHTWFVPSSALTKRSRATYHFYTLCSITMGFLPSLLPPILLPSLFHHNATLPSLLRFGAHRARGSICMWRLLATLEGGPSRYVTSNLVFFNLAPIGYILAKMCCHVPPSCYVLKHDMVLLALFILSHLLHPSHPPCQGVYTCNINLPRR